MTDLPPPPPPKGAIPPQAALPPRSPRIWPWIVGIVGVVVLIAIAIGAQWTSNQEPGTSDLGTEGSSSVVADDVAGNGYFDIFMVVRDAPLHEPFTVEAIDRTRFDFADGWDFGDRVAYACTWAEFYQGQDEKFEIAYHLVGDYPDFAQINDKYGAEIEGGDAGLQPICLQDSGVTNRADFRFDGGSSHFPHGADLVFYQGGSEIARINHDANTCGHLYWVAGDEPGEAWLWWDEDGASDKNEHGDGLCDGGPMEPVALVQAEVRSADSDIGYCTVSASARRCFNVN
jgi:hypothetical protein